MISYQSLYNILCEQLVHTCPQVIDSYSWLEACYIPCGSIFNVANLRDVHYIYIDSFSRAPYRMTQIYIEMFTRQNVYLCCFILRNYKNGICWNNFIEIVNDLPKGWEFFKAWKRDTLKVHFNTKFCMYILKIEKRERERESLLTSIFNKNQTISTCKKNKNF